MTARSHTDRGQLFGWDGANMWVEQTLGDAPRYGLDPVNVAYPVGRVYSGNDGIEQVAECACGKTIARHNRGSVWIHCASGSRACHSVTVTK